MKNVKIKLPNNIVVPVELDETWDCHTPEELHAVIRSHYGDDVMHFLEENAPDWEFVWDDELDDKALDALAKTHYARKDAGK